MLNLLSLSEVRRIAGDEASKESPALEVIAATISQGERLQLEATQSWICQSRSHRTELRCVCDTGTPPIRPTAVPADHRSLTFPPWSIGCGTGARNAR